MTKNLKANVLALGCTIPMEEMVQIKAYFPDRFMLTNYYVQHKKCGFFYMCRSNTTERTLKMCIVNWFCS